MVVSLTRMLKSFGQAQDDLPTLAANNAQEMGVNHNLNDNSDNVDIHHNNDGTQSNHERAALTPPERVDRIRDALAQVNDIHSSTPLTDRYLSNRAHMRPTNRPPFDPDTLWYLKHGRCPIMTELVDVVDEATLNAMPIEAVAILDRINGKLKRYREWSSELNEQQQQQHNERQFVIDKLVSESIPEALHHYEQLQRFSPHRTKNNMAQGKMTAGDMLTDLFLEIDYELDELLDELHQTVLNRLASTHRYVKSRTQS
ncbi:hypothetical protein SAMN05660405_01859 [Psychrobacter pacificensis]|uniref:Uncharacterized protein n=2 Tax=Psychrobacter pacificensis TaxID=112002 RepID=A0A1G6YYJ0_9GAMM|nr:hypothetical protein GCM10007915_02720 [Psychrobacter pacificensis]SDD95381.1 hypothetical protein SAMN05660405_01859 [Psychrobacter pacificensis]